MRTVKLLFTMSFQALVSAPLKSVSMRYTGSERRPKIDADQLLSDLLVERTGTAYSLKEVRLSNPYLSRRVYNGRLCQSHSRRKEKVNKSDDESQR